MMENQVLMEDTEADEFKPLETSRDEEEDEEALKDGDGGRSREESGWWNIKKRMEEENLTLRKTRK